MSDDAASPDVRIGSAEREEAMKSLADHMAAGRLEPDEYGDRVAQASVARFRSDLAPLFADLPSAPVAMRPSSPASPDAQRRSTARADPAGHAPIGGRTGTTIVALSPFLAVALFFLLHALGFDLAWLAFLLIPAAGAVVYGGPGGDRSRSRRR